jgi:thiamine pyrophosphokinase
MPAEEGVSDEVVVVVAGGPSPDARAALAVPAGARVIAADEGLEHAVALGLDVSVTVGDFDSVSPDTLAAAEADGMRVERHPAEKDATDLELALDAALALGASHVLVIAGDGAGRLDHLVAALLLLASPRYEGVEIDAVVGTTRIHVVRDKRELAGAPGELVTLVAVNGPALGVSTEGLAYPLRGETLEPGSTRGVSNVFASDMALITIAGGVLLAIRPGDGDRGNR